MVLKKNKTAPISRWNPEFFDCLLKYIESFLGKNIENLQTLDNNKVSNVELYGINTTDSIRS